MFWFLYIAVTFANTHVSYMCLLSLRVLARKAVLWWDGDKIVHYIVSRCLYRTYKYTFLNRRSYKHKTQYVPRVKSFCLYLWQWYMSYWNVIKSKQRLQMIARNLRFLPPPSARASAAVFSAHSLACARANTQMCAFCTHVDKVINKKNWGSFTRLDLPRQHLLLRLLFFHNSHLKHIETQQVLPLETWSISCHWMVVNCYTLSMER